MAKYLQLVNLGEEYRDVHYTNLNFSVGVKFPKRKVIQLITIK